MRRWASWGLCPQTPGIYRIAAQGKLHLPWTSTRCGDESEGGCFPALPYPRVEYS